MSFSDNRLNGSLRRLYENIEWTEFGIGKCSCRRGLGTEFCGQVDVCRGYIPRVIFGGPNIENVRIIVVGLNPGHPYSEEAGYYCSILKEYRTELQSEKGLGISRHVNDDLARRLMNAQFEWGRRCNIRAPETYQKNLMKLLRDTLCVTNFEEVIEQTYFTELVKCSTTREVGQSFRTKSMTPNVLKCKEDWLDKELGFFCNKVPILALGKDVHWYLMNSRSQIENPVVYVKHPTYPMRADIRVDKIKEIQSYLTC